MDDMTHLAILEHVMPWPNLYKISTSVTKCFSEHQLCNLSYAVFTAAVEHDLHLLRIFHLEIIKPALDIRVGKTVWHSRILYQCAYFENLKNVMLYVHQSRQS